MTRPRTVGLLAFVAFFLMGTAWALALPVNGTYDEKQHVVRAYAAVTFQTHPEGTAVDAAGIEVEAFDAPRSLLPENADCTWHPKPPKPASCQRQVTDRGKTLMPSNVARYNPVYYLLVGVPLLISPDQTGVVWSRLLSVLWSALLLAAAVAIAALRRSQATAVGIVLVSTPLVMNLDGSVNPNGLEISAGVLLFVSLMAMLRPAVAAGDAGSTDSPSTVRFLSACLAVSGVLLLTVRLFGPIMLACALACALVAVGPRRSLAALRRPTILRVVGVPCAVAAVYSAWWIWYADLLHAPAMPGVAHRWSAVEVLRRIPSERGRFYVDQVVARFGYGETTVSPLMVYSWYALVTAFLLLSFWFASVRLRMATAGAMVASCGILAALEVHFVPTVGWSAHSRYVLPLGVGVVLLGAGSNRLETFLRSRSWSALSLTVLAFITIPLDLYAFARVLTRFRGGVDAGINPLHGGWQPVLGPVPPLLAAMLGPVLLVAVVWFVGRSIRPVPLGGPVGSVANVGPSSQVPAARVTD